jgi:hypothetical protein
MTRERTLSKLKLGPVTVDGANWVEARWQRSDGSNGDAVASFVRLSNRWRLKWLLVGFPTGELLRDVPLAKIETAVNADPKIQEWIAAGTAGPTIERFKSVAAKRRQLSRPERRRLDDGFFELVADAYRGAAALGLPPAKTLAQESETPPGTVNRWIAEARKRGHLPPAQPGKVSA